LAETDNWKDTKGGRKWVREYVNRCYAVCRRIVATRSKFVLLKGSGGYRGPARSRSEERTALFALEVQVSPSWRGRTYEYAARDFEFRPAGEVLEQTQYHSIRKVSIRTFPYAMPKSFPSPLKLVLFGRLAGKALAESAV
jgi:hypothetical protein